MPLLVIGARAPWLSTITMTLPLELLMHICDFAASTGDRRTLKQCSLICSQLAIHCRGYLFARVTLTINERSVADQRRVQRLETMMEKNRGIGRCIKSLSIQFSSCYDHTSLPPFLAMCTGVVSLELSVFYVWSEEWTARPTLLPDATDAALDCILSSGSLAKLSISGFQTPTQAFFAACHASLKHLTIGDESATQALSSEKGRIGSPIHLQYLEARPMTLSQLASAEREDGRAVFNFSQLRQVSTRFKELEDDTQHINTLLHSGVPLETLSLFLTGKVTSFLQGFQLLIDF